jgi:signal transduction histidine kinase
MAASLLIPVVVALVFGGLRVESSYRSWREAADAAQTARLVQASTDLIYALDQERDLSVTPILTGSRNDPALQKLYADTSAAIDAFNAVARKAPRTGNLQNRLATVAAALPKLADLRAEAYRTVGVTTQEGYISLMSALQALDNELTASAGSNITSDARAIYALTLTKDSVSLLRSIVLHMLLEKNAPKDSQGRQQQVVRAFGYGFLQKIAETEFLNAADARNRKDYLDALKQGKQEGAEQLRQAAAAAETAGKRFIPPPSIEQMVSQVNKGLSNEQLAALGITPESWMAATTLSFQTLRGVEQRLTARAVDNAARTADAARSDALRNGTLVVLALLLAAMLTALVARSMIVGTRILRDSAQHIAAVRLPELVRRLSKTDPDPIDTAIRPIPLSGQDEMAEVARAFDEVHREAVRLATEQALMRGNVNAIFTNLSRRSQGLVSRLLNQITDLESREADPDQLARLFRLDHLATQMRRHGENLLVLAGEEPSERWTRPAPLFDVLRAAVSEVEQYERIDIQSVPPALISASVVKDLVHLLAELLENATTYSGAETPVEVEATTLPDGRLLIEIRDRGRGLTPEERTAINVKLSHPPTVDISVSRRMGLFVVGRLAQRHDIRVQLRPADPVGTSALIMLPVHAGSTSGAPTPTPPLPTEHHRLGPLATVPNAPAHDGGPVPGKTGEAPSAPDGAGHTWHGQGYRDAGASPDVMNPSIDRPSTERGFPTPPGQ